MVAVLLVKAEQKFKSMHSKEKKERELGVTFIPLLPRVEEVRPNPTSMENGEGATSS